MPSISSLTKGQKIIQHTDLFAFVDPSPFFKIKLHVIRVLVIH